MNLISFGTAASFFTIVALVIPLFLLAILVDASRNAKRIGPVAASQSYDKVSIRQSRRTLLSVAVGGLCEIESLIYILTDRSNSSAAINTIDFLIIAFIFLGLLILLYVLFIPHIELHVSNIRNDPGTARWSIVIGWASVAFFLANAVTLRFLGRIEGNIVIGYVLLALSLVGTGSMIIFTFSTVRQGRLKAHNYDQPLAEQGKAPL
jgi:hypothetical protein